MCIYEKIQHDYSDVIVIKKTNNDGNVSWIPTDPANSDYQAYLNRDKPQDEAKTK